MNHRSATPPAPEAVSATQLREAIAADPGAPIVAAIQGAGGYGKTTMLTRIARIYRDAGVEVYAPDDVSAEFMATADVALLADDAHRLSEGKLRELCTLAESRSPRLIVAYRPWPQPEPLAELISLAGRHRPPVRLRELAEPELAERLARSYEPAVHTDFAERVRKFTGGVPGLVAKVIDAVDMRELSTSDEPRLPRVLLDRFQRELNRLDPESGQCLTALAVGSTPHPALLAKLLGSDSTRAANALETLRAAGLLDASDAPHPVVRAVVSAMTPWEQRLATLRELVAIQLDRGGSVLPLVRPLLDVQEPLLPDASMASAFEAAGDEAIEQDADLAGRLYRAAVSAGAAAAPIAARRARAAAVAGKADEALRIADSVMIDPSAPDRVTAIQVSATVLAQRGLLARSAELCRWSIDHVRWPGDEAFTIVGLVGTGRGEEAARLRRSGAENGPPTSLSGATTQLAAGMHESITGTASSALSILMRSASLAEPVGNTVLMPDTPAAITATVAVHNGEFDVAESVLDRALLVDSGGALLRTRHRLLAALIPMMRGDTVTARRALSAATEDIDSLQTRDRLLAVAIEAGIAGRDNDMSGLGKARSRARRAVAEHPADLFSLLPLSELVLGAARLRDRDWLLPHLREARSVLSALGDPPLWSALLQWRSLQSAIVLEEPHAVREHAEALERISSSGSLAAALADASGVWISILDGEINRDQVERSAKALHACGLEWDGASLAGQAAVRTTDRKTMLGLLECARALQGKTPRPQRHPASVKASAAGKASGSAIDAPVGAGELLSDREREVAELVLAGLTYKQVGQRLFISAKTVEHHVGRIKQRLDCATREDLLARLRQLIG